MTETSALATLADNVADKREYLRHGLAQTQDLFHSDNGYGYAVAFEAPDGASCDWVFLNTPDHTYAKPQVGTVWPEPLFGRADWVVRHSQQFVQPEALAARELLEQAKDKADGLESLTSEDLDALMQLPKVLDQGVTNLRAARQSFRDAGVELASREQELLSSNWSDEASRTYSDSLRLQARRIEWCHGDIDALDEATVRLAQAAIDVYEALATIYINDMKKSRDILDKLVLAPSTVLDWKTYAGALVDELDKATTIHAENFLAALERLGEQVTDERLIAKAQEIGEWPEWPAPSAEKLSNPCQ
ncbi:hypothetical protein [uncultured Tessaracoccus sp.]|uniref:hypothetical protein n=1 Tax=uncultured Tessaracoccus sp. TaxID=905023 RepID=UPI0025CC5071|nr:hypothetical protein [uncultured Tessaracoccus sp.]